MGRGTVDRHVVTGDDRGGWWDMMPLRSGLRTGLCTNHRSCRA